CFHRVRKDEYGIDAAHFGKNWNRHRTSGGSIKERTAGLQRAGESNSTRGGMANKCDAQRRLSSMHQREDALGHVAVPRPFMDYARRQLGGPGVRRMSLTHPRISGGERGCRSAATNGKRQRKVARTKYYNRAKRNQHSAQIRFRRRAVRIRLIDAGVYPRAL